MGVVDVQQGVVGLGQGEEGRQVGRVAGHQVDPVHADQARGLGVPAQQPLQGLGVVVGVADHGGAVGPGGHATVPDRLVGPGVDEDGPVRGQHRDDRGVDVGQGRQQQRVGRPHQLGQPGLDLPVQRRAAQALDKESFAKVTIRTFPGTKA
jgi:hypothetical protein